MANYKGLFAGSRGFSVRDMPASTYIEEVMVDGGDIINNPGMGVEAIGNNLTKSTFGWNPILSAAFTLVDENTINPPSTFHNLKQNAVIPYFDANMDLIGVLRYDSVDGSDPFDFTKLYGDDPESGMYLFSPQYAITVARCGYAWSDIEAEEGVFTFADAEKNNGIKVIREINAAIDTGWLPGWKKIQLSGLNIMMDQVPSNSSTQYKAHAGRVQTYQGDAMLENEVGTDGNFETATDGLGTGWTASGTVTSKSVSSNVQTFKGTQWAYIKHVTPAHVNAVGDQMYMCAFVKKDAGTVKIGIGTGTSTSKVNKTIAANGEWEFASCEYTAADGFTDLFPLVQDQTGDATVEVKKVYFINRTRQYGAGNEPSKATLDAKYSAEPAFNALVDDQLKIAPAGAGTHANNDVYNDYILYITEGTGAGQRRTITDYDGTTKIVTIDEAWTTQPDGTSLYYLAAYPDMPDWLMDAIFDVANNRIDGKAYNTYADSKTSGFCPNPANATLIAKYELMIEALADYYKDDPIFQRKIVGDVGHWGEFHIANIESVYASGTSQAGGSATTIVLAAGASTSDDIYNGMTIDIGGLVYRTIIDYDGTSKVATLDEASGVTNDEVEYDIHFALNGPVDGTEYMSNTVLNQYLAILDDHFGADYCEIRRNVGDADTLGFGYFNHGFGNAKETQVFGIVGGGIDGLNNGGTDDNGVVQVASTGWQDRHRSIEPYGSVAENADLFQDEPTTYIDVDDVAGEWEQGNYGDDGAKTETSAASFYRTKALWTLSGEGGAIVVTCKVRYGSPGGAHSDGYYMRLLQYTAADEFIELDTDIACNGTITLHANCRKIAVVVYSTRTSKSAMNAARCVDANPRIYVGTAAADRIRNIEWTMKQMEDYGPLIYADDLSDVTVVAGGGTAANVKTFLNKIGYRLGTTIRHRSKVDAASRLLADLTIHNIGIAKPWLPNYKMEISLLEADGHAVAWSTVMDCPKFDVGDTVLQLNIPVTVEAGNYHIAIAIYHPTFQDDLYVSMYGGTAEGHRTIISDVEIA